MIVSELCANGDLFDYVRNVHPPSLHKVVRVYVFACLSTIYTYTATAKYDA
jgi:hypothetical protein